MYPSIKTLRRLFRPEDQKNAAKLRRLLDGRLNPDHPDHPGQSCKENRCHNSRERRLEAIMDAADRLLNGHGNEALTCPGYHGGFYHDIHASYVNMGDTYALTLVLDHESEKFLVTSWGDYLEREEAKKGGCWNE